MLHDFSANMIFKPLLLFLFAMKKYPMQAMCVFLALLLAPAAFAAEAPLDIYVSVYDAQGHVVPDAVILVDYQIMEDGNISERTFTGFTDVGGQMGKTLYFGENETISNYVYIWAYTPFYSPTSQRLRVPLGGKREVQANFTIPYNFNTYRILISGEGGAPLSGVNVRTLSPAFTIRKTNANGLAQFRFPEGLPVFGIAQRQGIMQFFNLSRGQGEASVLPLTFPTSGQVPLDINKTYNWTVQMLDPHNKALSSIPFTLQTRGINATYFSDSRGFLRIFEIPYSDLVLSWELYNHTYEKEINLSKEAPGRIISDSVLKIHEPSIIHLGESCYRVEVNITDPRQGVIKQVVARTEDFNQTLALTLEQNQSFNESKIAFYRLFCVLDDTNFDIIASSPYEYVSLKIQLLKNKEVVQIDSPVVAQKSLPPEVAMKMENEKKIELIVILIELLMGLVFLYILLRFRAATSYILQSILRAVYFLVQGAKKPKEPKGF